MTAHNYSVKKVPQGRPVIEWVIIGVLVGALSLLFLVYFVIPGLLARNVLNAADVTPEATTSVATTSTSLHSFFASLILSTASTTAVGKSQLAATGTLASTSSSTTAAIAITHVPTPAAVKAIYMTSWVAGDKTLRERLVKIIDTTEINSVVIDIKDYSGRISYDVGDPALKALGAEELRIKDIREFIAELHAKNIYVIGRLSSFQDAYMVKKFPERAVKRESDGGVWKDHKGISWIDAGNQDHWKYLIDIAKDSYAAGFDEINFDYIRFPSDGNMKDIAYPFSGERSKVAVLRSFFEYIHNELSGTGIVTSADLFGMTTTNYDDLGIGQSLENALPYFDYIAPMVYPSHYPVNFNGWKNPNAYPGELIKFVMSEAVMRAVATTSRIQLPGSELIASTSPRLYTKESINPEKLRPWLQDFSLGAPRYGAAEVRAQIDATYASGLTSWMLWDAANKYTASALHAE